VTPAPVTGLCLAVIKPPRGEMDGVGKFSPNLYRWVAKYLRRFNGAQQWPVVFRDNDGQLYIGNMAPEGWFSGARLWRVLCNGAKQESYAWRPKDTRGFKLVPNFWARYLKVGRCAIDVNHTRYADDARWSVKGKTRTCNWCGKRKERLRTKTVTKRVTTKKWVKA
jgi:hypothetical protein